MVGQGAALAAIGLMIGTAAAMMLSRLMDGLLCGVSSRDPLSFVAAAVVLLLATLTASYVPARNATRVDPATALRSE